MRKLTTAVVLTAALVAGTLSLAAAPASATAYHRAPCEYSGAVAGVPHLACLGVTAVPSLPDHATTFTRYDLYSKSYVSYRVAWGSLNNTSFMGTLGSLILECNRANWGSHCYFVNDPYSYDLTAYPTPSVLKLGSPCHYLGAAKASNMTYPRIQCFGSMGTIRRSFTGSVLDKSTAYSGYDPAANANKHYKVSWSTWTSQNFDGFFGGVQLRCNTTLWAGACYFTEH